MSETEDKINFDYKFEILRLDVCGVELTYIPLPDGCK